MATIIIETRSRATTEDVWGAWSNLPVDAVTDGTFTNTSLVEYRIGDTSITADDLTNATDVTAGQSNGSGVFDVLMDAYNLQIESDWNQGRIKGTDYANVRLGAMQSAMQFAIQFLLGKDKAAFEFSQLLPAQKALIERQTKGFDDDAKQKLLKQMLDSWSVAYSVAKDANAIPDTIKVNPIDSVAKNAMDNLEITNTNNPLGEA